MKYTLFSLILIALISCKKEEPIDYTTQNDEDIQTYLSDHNLTAEKTNSGLYYIIDSIGSGLQPSESDNVTVAYKGYYTDGSVFDASTSDGISFGLNQVIDGWTEGIPYFNEGGSGILLIPSHLGYGDQDYYDIPAGSVLTFDIHLISID